MEKKDSNTDKQISLMKIKSPGELLTLKSNKAFCNKFFEQSAVSSAASSHDYLDESNNLVYDLSRASNLDAEAFGAIIDLLMQLRAAGNDQNVFIQNNTVVREQILSQLKNEILKVSHKLTSNQIRNLEVISSNSFDEKTLADILKSLLESSKKKLTGSEFGSAEARAKGASRYITLDKVSKSYLTILNKSLYYEKVVDKILKNVSLERVRQETELVKLDTAEQFSQPEGRVYLKRKSLKELFTKKSRIDVSKVLEEISKSREENIINKMGLIPHVIRFRSKISEMNIVTRTGSFVEDIVKNSVPKILESETDLINKIVDTSKINELRENIILSQQQREQDRVYQERSINRVYSEVRKLYNSKNLFHSITEVLKSTNAQALNIEENVKKSLLKLAYKKDITNKFRNINDSTVESTSLSKVTERTELVNRQNVEHVDIEEKTALSDTLKLEHALTFSDKKFTEDIRENNILARSARIRRRNYKRIHKNSGKLNIDFYEDDNFSSVTSSSDLINLKRLNVNDVEDYLLKQKNMLISQVNRNILSGKHEKIIENTEKKIKNEIISVNEKEIHEKLKSIFSKESTNILRHSKAKPFTVTQDSDGTKTELWNKEDIYKFIPVHVKENILGKDEIENIFTRNIIRVLSPQSMRAKSFMVSEKNIYKNFTRNQIKKYIENSYSLEKEYLIKEKESLSKESQYSHTNHGYMIYKEPELGQNQEPHQKKSVKPREEKKEPDIVIKEKEPFPVTTDAQTMEKNIMAKVLSEKDVVALIESYLNDVNAEKISQNVIEKVERKFIMDRRRNGRY